MSSETGFPACTCAMFWDEKHKLHFCIFHAFITIYNHFLIIFCNYYYIFTCQKNIPSCIAVSHTCNLCLLLYQLILQVFNGNSGRNDTVKHSLKEYASARFIRFQPTTYFTHKALRVEVFGVLVSTGIDLNWWSNIHVAGADPGFFRGKGRRWLGSWGFRINEICPQNVAICEPIWILFHQKYWQCYKVEITVRSLSRHLFFIFPLFLNAGGQPPNPPLLP